jgi:hypothetical protein
MAAVRRSSALLSLLAVAATGMAATGVRPPKQIVTDLNSAPNIPPTAKPTAKPNSVPKPRQQQVRMRVHGAQTVLASQDICLEFEPKLYDISSSFTTAKFHFSAFPGSKVPFDPQQWVFGVQRDSHFACAALTNAAMTATLRSVFSEKLSGWLINAGGLCEDCRLNPISRQCAATPVCDVRGCAVSISPFGRPCISVVERGTSQKRPEVTLSARLDMVQPPRRVLLFAAGGLATLLDFELSQVEPIQYAAAFLSGTIFLPCMALYAAIRFAAGPRCADALFAVGVLIFAALLAREEAQQRQVFSLFRSAWDMRLSVAGTVLEAPVLAVGGVIDSLLESCGIAPKREEDPALLAVGQLYFWLSGLLMLWCVRDDLLPEAISRLGGSLLQCFVTIAGVMLMVCSATNPVVAPTCLCGMKLWQRAVDLHYRFTLWRYSTDPRNMRRMQSEEEYHRVGKEETASAMGALRRRLARDPSVLAKLPKERRERMLNFMQGGSHIGGVCEDGGRWTGCAVM